MVDFDKPVQTVDGKPARVLCTDRKGLYPVIGLVVYPDGTEKIFQFRADGCCPGVPTNTLKNAPERKEFYSNTYVYPDGRVQNGFAFDSIRKCKDNARLDNHVGYTKHTLEDKKIVAVEFIPA